MGSRIDTRDELHRRKLQNAATYLKNAGWRSTNEFILDHYNTPSSASQSLRLQPQSTSYAPNDIMAAWLANVPSGAEKELHLSIMRHAAQIMVNESTAAYHNEKLCLSSSGLDIPYLTTDFGLKQIQNIYSQLLPCLSILLIMLLTAPNDYEKRKGAGKVGKDANAARVSLYFYSFVGGALIHVNAVQVLVVVISMLLFFRNRATNAFQLVVGVFLSSSGASRRIIETFNHMGLSVSYQWVPSLIPEFPVLYYYP